MSVVVTIPKDRNPFIVIVNGVRYSYPAGADVEVPDPVADVIEKYVNAKPKPKPKPGGSDCSCGGSGGSGGSGGTSEEWIGDGNTHIWITLHEGRTSPMLGVCPKGTVTVDWGDGTTPDVLTGTSLYTLKWTPNHEYANPGDYVITLTVDGEMAILGRSQSLCCLLRYSTDVSDATNNAYLNEIQKIEIGNGVTRIDGYGVAECHTLKSVKIGDGVTYIGEKAFADAYSLASITIADSVTNIGANAFFNCRSLVSVKIPNGVTSITNSTFEYCYSLKSVTVPSNVTNIDSSAFCECSTLESVEIQDGVTQIGSRAFYCCRSLKTVTIPSSVTNIGENAFYCAYSCLYYDFSKHVAVPTLSATNAFLAIPADCEIRVPTALYDEWKAATNWATYASNIAAV